MRTCEFRSSEFPKGIISFCLVALSISFALAQTAPTTTTSAAATSSMRGAASTQLQTFQAAQLALASDFQSLIDQGATPDQIQAWQQKNAGRIAAQQKLAQLISASDPIPTLAYVTGIDISSGASQTMVDFLTVRANLSNLRAQLHNQQLQSSGTVDESKLEATFEQQNASALQAQAQRVQVLAVESNQQPLPVPPPLIFRPGITPQMQAFLSLRDQIMRGEIQVHNQSLQLSETARENVMQQWRQQNSYQFQQLQALAQNLTSASQN